MNINRHELLNIIRPETKAPESKVETDLRLTPENFEKIGWRCFYAANKERKRYGVSGAEPAFPSDRANLLTKEGKPIVKVNLIRRKHRYEASENDYGDNPIMADVKSEEAVLNELAQTNIRWHVRSEEHGEVYIQNGKLYAEKPDDYTAEAFAVLDGIDGSKADEARLSGDLDRIRLSEEDKGQHMEEKDKLSKRAGTMLSFAPVPDPSFNDFTFAGMLEHDYDGDQPNNQGRLVYATEGRGVFVRTPFEFRRILPPTNPKERLGAGDTITYLELDYFGVKNVDGRKFEKNLHDKGILAAKLLSSGSHHIDFILGESMPRHAILQTGRSMRFGDIAGYDIYHRAGEDADSEQEKYKVFDPIGAVVESERKGYEEFVVANTFMRVLYEDTSNEMNNVGVVQTLDDEGNIVNLGDLNYKECVKRWFERPHKQLRPIVLAHTPSVARQLLTMS